MPWLRDNPCDIGKYLPDFLQSEDDFKNVLTAESSEHERQRLRIADLLNQMYIWTADWGLARWENILQLTPRTGSTVEERRHAILLKLCGRQTSTVHFMEWLIDRFTDIGGTVIEEHNDQYSFVVDIQGNITDKRGLIGAVETYKPAHLGYLFRYRIIDLIDDILASDDPILADVETGLQDIVPYGRALDLPRYDGKHKVVEAYRMNGALLTDGSRHPGDFPADALKLPGAVDWNFVFDGLATADGSFTAIGDLIANGQRPWVLQYNDFMDELSVIVISMRKPDGTTQLEDDVATILKVGEGIKANGSAKAGKTFLPVDTGGRLDILRGLRANGTVKLDGGDINYTDGSILTDGAFRMDGGGYHPRIERYTDELDGGFSLVRPKKGPSLILRYPELFDDIELTDASTSDVVLDDFEDTPGIAAEPFRARDGIRMDGQAKAGAGNLVPVDLGGTLSIYHVLIANGRAKADGGVGDKADSTIRMDGARTLSGGERFEIRRHDKSL